MNKASGGEGIPVEVFQILEDDVLKVLHSIRHQIWKIQQWPQTWKRLIFIPIPKKGNAKECSDYSTIALISHASKVMPKILQARLQQYMNYELPDVQAGFRKGRGTRDQIANKDHGIQSHHFMANRWGNNGNSERLFWGAPKSLQMVTAAMKLKDSCSLEEKL